MLLEEDTMNQPLEEIFMAGFEFYINFNPFTDAHDNVYGVLEWRDDPLMAAAFMGSFCLVISPAIFVILWLCSLRGRRYVNEEPLDETSVDPCV